MKSWRARLTIAVVVMAAALTTVSSTFAQGPDDPRRGGPRLNFIRALMQEVSDVTGLELTDILPDLRGGVTLGEFLTEQGVDPQTVTDAVKADLTDEVNAAVAEGNLSQERADALLENLDAALDRAMNEPYNGGLRDRLQERLHERVDASLLGVLAEMAGVEPRELMRDALTPPTLAEIAEENGIDINAVIAAAETRITEEVNQAVADGSMTQEEADELLAGLHDRLTERVNSPLRLNLRERIGERDGRFIA